MNDFKAYIIHKNQIHLSSTSQIHQFPWTPVSVLIHGIYEKWKEQSYYILRNKIYINYSATELCYGIAKVAAKGLKYLPYDNFSLLNTKNLDEFIYSPWRANEYLASISIKNSLNNSEWMKKAVELAEQSARDTKFLFERDRPIASILVNSKGQLLEVALNTNKTNKVQHAEWNLVQSYWQKTKELIPQNARIYTTVKCCKMCAGLIWHCSETPGSVEVFYREFDPGPHARFTLFNHGSHEQRRSLSPSDFKEYETQLSP